MKTKTSTRVYPRIVTPETIAEARAWLLEAAEMDGMAPTQENLRAIAKEHAAICPAGGHVFRQSLLLAFA